MINYNNKIGISDHININYNIKNTEFIHDYLFDCCIKKILVLVINNLDYKSVEFIVSKHKNRYVFLELRVTDEKMTKLLNDLNIKTKYSLFGSGGISINNINIDYSYYNYNSSLIVGRNFSVGGDLSVGRNCIVDGDLTVNGNIQVNGTLITNEQINT